jgi:hypothetical protein
MDADKPSVAVWLRDARSVGLLVMIPEIAVAWQLHQRSNPGVSFVAAVCVLAAFVWLRPRWTDSQKLTARTQGMWLAGAGFVFLMVSVVLEAFA